MELKQILKKGTSYKVQIIDANNNRCKYRKFRERWVGENEAVVREHIVLSFVFLIGKVRGEK